MRRREVLDRDKQWARDRQDRLTCSLSGAPTTYSGVALPCCTLTLQSHCLSHSPNQHLKPQLNYKCENDLKQAQLSMSSPMFSFV